MNLQKKTLLHKFCLPFITTYLIDKKQWFEKAGKSGFVPVEGFEFFEDQNEGE